MTREEAALKHFEMLARALETGNYYDDFDEIDDYINIEDLYVAIEALQERPKGRWIEVYDLDYLKFIWSCDQCGEDAPTKQETCDQILKPFCPNCGAEMER